MKDVKRAETITLDNLIATSSRAAVESLREYRPNDKLINPKIWVGIWIEPYSLPDFKAPNTGG